MIFVIDRNGNNFGDKMVTIKNVITGEIRELTAYEGEHHNLNQDLKRLKVVRLTKDETNKLIKAMALLYVFKVNPLDKRFVKVEFNQHKDKIKKIARVISELEIDEQVSIIRNIWK